MQSLSLSLSLSHYFQALLHPSFILTSIAPAPNTTSLHCQSLVHATGNATTINLEARKEPSGGSCRLQPQVSRDSTIQPSLRLKEWNEIE